VKIKLAISLLSILLFTNLHAQFEYKVTTNKIVYDYGEIIYVSSRLTNISDTAVTISFGSTGSCQAHFQLDEYKTNLWYSCLPMVQEVTISPGRARVYNWTIDPSRLGIPKTGGDHKLFSYISYKLDKSSNSSYQTLHDSIYFEAPMYLGGQIFIGFTQSNDSLLEPLRDSLNVIVLNRNSYLSTRTIVELWQIHGYQIDSLSNDLWNDDRVMFVELNGTMEYDSITVTSITQESEIINKFFLSNAYPNPFNATSRFNIELPQTDQVNIVLFNILGEKVSTIYSGELSSNIRYTFEIDATKLSSGIYYYLVNSSNILKTKKVVLLK